MRDALVLVILTSCATAEWQADIPDGAAPGYGPTSEAAAVDAWAPAPDAAPPVDAAPPDPVDDADLDGYTEAEGDCDDSEWSAHPGALEITTLASGAAELLDNDCDGAIDEPAGICDASLSAVNAAHVARAIDLCDAATASAALPASSSPYGRALLASLGVITPRLGSSMLALSTGAPSAVALKQPGMSQGTQHPHPYPQPASAAGCAAADQAIVYDYQEVSLDLVVPSNARSLSFAWQFLSSEFPEGICWGWLDSFLVLVEGSAFSGSATRDGAGDPITSDSTFITLCNPFDSVKCLGDAALAYTGFDGGVGAGTGWRHTVIPVTPGAVVRVRLVLFDENGWGYDSMVLVDAFRWHTGALPGPQSW